ncbi:unnamed protein product [Cercospora beticola]|nr:unnamed protein product [Cercospora beticola]
MQHPKVLHEDPAGQSLELPQLPGQPTAFALQVPVPSVFVKQTQLSPEPHDVPALQVVETHCPPLQVVPTGHRLLQLPQFSGSLSRTLQELLLHALGTLEGRMDVVDTAVTVDDDTVVVVTTTFVKIVVEVVARTLTTVVEVPDEKAVTNALMNVSFCAFIATASLSSL